MMDTLANSSPIRTYMDNYHKIRVSHDTDRSDTIGTSLAVVNLNLSLSPDVFGLRAFDASKPLTRILSVSSPCELRLKLPDSDSGPEGFHDVIVENLAVTPTWRSRHISPRDVTSLRRRWPNAVFGTMLEGDGAAPSFRSSSTGVGVSA